MIYHQKLEEAPFPLHHHRLRRQELLILAENVQSTSDSAADLVAVIPRLHHLSTFLLKMRPLRERLRNAARERLLQAPP
ncbi:hypothetical protein QR680_000010 [Steinernema hermaphroditum]|uniref:Uncharacterized protein n=1 Tax=Steinernema hermaphroditum TaxID=289476 RepID=A0AA39GSX8_9BILA|nr:hypothetical protein QR680_000010 [Steinernema hermaphroditum]